MDTIYTGDIPQTYNKAIFGSNYIDLYDTNYISPNSSVTYYRVYFYDNTFVYDTLTRNASYNGITLSTTQVEVSDEVWYRRDIDSILTVVLIISIFGLFLINLVTITIKRGGVLGGLL